MLQRGLAFLLISLLAACATAPKPTLPIEASVDDKVCLDFIRHFDDKVKGAGTADGQSAKIPGFPFLRINRFYASYVDSLEDKARFAEWLQALRGLDAEARGFEYANLPVDVKSKLPAEAKFASLIDACGRRSVQAVLAEKEKKQDLLGKARVADNYSSWKRLLGLYPLSSLFVTSRIQVLQRRLQQGFDMALADVSVNGRLQRYGTGKIGLPEHLRLAPNNRLGIPTSSARELQALFQRHAPVFEIDVVDDNDRPGVPAYRNGDNAVIDVDQATIYWLTSYTRFQGEVLLQLNYVIWFPARSPTRRLDIYAGDIDSLIWRVTLDRKGEPLIYDSVHSCGCYHQLYPVQGLALKPEALELREPPFVPQSVARLRADERLIVRVSHGAHYVQRVYPEKEPAFDQVLTPVSYQQLRSLPWRRNQNKSLFQPSGLIKGTERPERWLLWPMGIASAGAMRQWGHHAVAFVGRRHFDDPYLIGRFFTLMP